jgi:uncharacterized PurR-regulated membrane protein YhhQ (DUF165 family)
LQTIGIVGLTTTFSVASAIAIFDLARSIFGGVSAPEAVFGAIAASIIRSFTLPLSTAITSAEPTLLDLIENIAELVS